MGAQTESMSVEAVAEQAPEEQLQSQPLRYVGRYGWIGLFLLLVLSSVIGLVTYDGISARKAFLSDQQTLARSAVTSGEAQLLMLLNYLDSELRLFALQQQLSGSKLQQATDVYADLARLKKALVRRLPDLQGLAFAIPSSDELLADNPGLLSHTLAGDAAEVEASRGKARISLHTTGDKPNFHVMVRIPGPGAGVLIALIDVLPLQQILATLSPPGHELIIQQSVSAGLISVTKDAVLRQANAATDRPIFFSADLVGSDWQLLDRPEEGLLMSNLQRILIQRGIILVLMLVSTLLIFQLLWKRHREFVKAQDALLEANQQLIFSSQHDHLTQLPNRASLEERLQEKIAAADPKLDQFLLMLININEFKRINKNLGYMVGDQILQQVAIRIQQMLPEADMVARFEGDVFAVICPVQRKTQASTIARRVLDALKQPFDLANNPISVTASIGAAVFPYQGREMQLLLRHADSAVAQAKFSGGKTVVFANDTDAQGLDYLSLISGIKEAMHDGQLQMVYQPKLSLTEPERHDFEALLRWHHKDYGVLPAGSYIPLIEQTRHIVDLTHWTIDVCFALQKKMLDLGVNVNIAVNLSARVLDEEGFPLWVERIIRKYDLTPSSVRFELTESAMMHDSERAMQVLLQLAGIGVGLSVDDFGVGQSSLAYISRLPVDELKVDKSFVDNMLEWESDRAIVKATIDLAHDLGLSVVAEGVETLEQATILREMECDRLQGYFISKPLTEQQLENWMASDREKIG